MTPLDHALALAAEGLAVFPCRPRDVTIGDKVYAAKSPLTTHGFQDATTDESTIEAWWRRWPDALVGVATGALLVVDVDPDGLPWFEEHALDLAYGRSHRTRRDGWHLLYANVDPPIGCSTSKLAQGVDVRGDGGYVIWWPAHGCDASGDLADIGPPPAWLEAKLRGRLADNGTGRPTVAALASGVTEGRRNDSLARLTGHLLARGVDPDAVREFALAWSQARCNPPMDPGEALRTIESILTREGSAHTWPGPLDLAALGRREPEAPPMIVDDWLPAGYATLIAGHGGAGKSSIALHLAACIALGREFSGLTPQRRRVLYLACEDRARVLHWRLARICRHMGVNMAVLAGQLEVLDLVGRDSILWERTAAGGRTTPAFNQLMAAAQGVDVIVVDGVADTYAGSENDRGDVKRYVNALVGLIHPDRGAVLLIHHVNKPAAGTATSEGYSGSTGWHNSARARWYLYPETAQSDESVERTGRLILELQKSNLGRADQSITFRWDEAAHLFVAEAMPQTSHMAEFSRDTDERDGIVAAIQAVEARGDYVPAAMQGPRTAWHVLTAVEGFPATLKGTRERRRFWRHIEHLRRIQTVRESSIRRSNRHVVPTLTLQAAADAGCADASHSSFENRARNDAGAPAPNASYSAGGYRGCARAHCPRCDDEGCDWCQRPTEGAAA